MYMYQFPLIYTLVWFGCGWMVCMVSVCVMCCCRTVFCRLGSSAHSTPTAIEQLEIIVLAFDILPSASLQILLHATILITLTVLYAV